MHIGLLKNVSFCLIREKNNNVMQPLSVKIVLLKKRYNQTCGYC